MIAIVSVGNSFIGTQLGLLAPGRPEQVFSDNLDWNSRSPERKKNGAKHENLHRGQFFVLNKIRWDYTSDFLVYSVQKHV